MGGIMDWCRSYRSALKAAVSGLAVIAIVGGCGSSGDTDVKSTGSTKSAPVAITATVVPTVTVTPTVTKTATSKPTVTTVKPTVQPTTTRATQAPRSTTSSSSAYYKNCTAARDAGAAPLRRGDPGYSTDLDRDDDGVACEN
jgi:hypothetical protein